MSMKPFEEKFVQDKFWQAEAWDENLPSPGYITDFVLATRGIEAATCFNFWVPVFGISAVVQRDAYLRWFPKNLYPNFYIFFVAPPGFKKGTSIGIMEDAIYDMPNYIVDPIEKVRKTINVIGSECTAEALHKRLKPKVVWAKNIANERIKLNLDSQGCVIASELPTFLGKQQYNQGMISKLTLLYDGKDRDAKDTLSRSNEKLKNTYLSIIGAATPGSLKDSIPEVAFGDGFMSRVIVVYNDEVTRVYSQPKEVIGGPTMQDLTDRLAWIAVNCKGEYVLSEEATKYQDEWYKKYKQQNLEGIVGSRAVNNRMDIHLLKLAHVLCMNEMKGEKVVQLKHVLEAQKVLEATVNNSVKAIEDVGVSYYQQVLQRVERALKSRGLAKRRTLLTSVSSSGITAEGLSKALDHLYQCGKIEIFRDGRKTHRASISGLEEYKWVSEVKK